MGYKKTKIYKDHGLWVVRIYEFKESQPFIRYYPTWSIAYRSAYLAEKFKARESRRQPRRRKS